MSKLGKTLLATLFTAILPSVLMAQMSVSLTREETTDVTDGTLKGLAVAAARNCGRYLRDARDPAKSVSERAEAAASDVQCIDKFTALAMAVAKPEDVPRIREMLQTDLNEAKAVNAKAESEENFLGLNWGLGFGFSVSSDDAVDDAEIVGGVVRVKSEKKQQPRALFEFHKYIWCNNNGKLGTRGCGPFVAVAATQDKVLSGVGMGLMYGFKTKATDSDGFSIGLGAILDSNVKDLADDFKRNQPPPDGETAVRYEQKARWSAILFVTRTF